ncbi:hypothetical protein B8W95_13305, partial [Staphylococcus pasteuri]
MELCCRQPLVGFRTGGRLIAHVVSVVRGLYHRDRRAVRIAAAAGSEEQAASPPRPSLFARRQLDARAEQAVRLR